MKLIKFESPFQADVFVPAVSRSFNNGDVFQVPDDEAELLLHNSMFSEVQPEAEESHEVVGAEAENPI